MKKVIFLSMLLAFCMLAYGQTYRIEGTVIDKTSRKPLEFVNVLVVGLGIGSSTDAEGHFSVEQVPPGIYRLQASNAMDVIEAERVKELYMEGFRLHDLKRWHKGFERKPQDQSLAYGSSLKVEADDPLFVWPIPQHELDAPGSQIQPNESNKLD